MHEPQLQNGPAYAEEEYEAPPELLARECRKAVPAVVDDLIESYARECPVIEVS